MTNKIIEQYKQKHNLTDNDIRKMKEIDPSSQHEGTLFTDYFIFESALFASRGKEITIYPDYDADGVCSGLIAYCSLKAMGYKNVNLIKPKTTDGYGLNLDVVIKEYPNTDVILTTDNGINAKNEVDKAYERGIQTIITDHHLGEKDYFPDKALAIVNPNRSDKNEKYPFKEISGSAVIYKLMSSYAFRNCKDDVNRAIRSLYPLVGISTISDVMPPLDENRYFMKAALQYLKLGIYEKTISSDINHVHDMLNLFVSCLENKYFKREDATLDLIGFRIAPILNSPRRMLDDSAVAFNAFLMNEKADLPYLICLNDERKKVVKDILSSVDVIEQNCIILQNDDIPHGVAGLVASHLVRTYNRPAFVLCKENAGSARAPEGMSVHDGLKYIHDTNPDILVSWGGHSAAAGVKVSQNHLDTFVDILNHFYLDKEPKSLQYNYLEIDPNDENQKEDALKAIPLFEEMQPFEKHMMPLYLINANANRDRYQVMKDVHVKLTLGSFVELINWNGAKEFFSNRSNHKREIEAICSAQENNFRGMQTLQFVVNEISYH